jgi:hypothetical protein
MRSVEEGAMSGTLLALGAAIVVSGTVAAFLPHTHWGRFLSNIVFVYTMAPVFRRTVMPHAPEKTFEKSYWTMSAIVVVFATLLEVMVKPLFGVSGVVVTVGLVALVAWIARRLRSSSQTQR